MIKYDRQICADLPVVSSWDIQSTAIFSVWEKFRLQHILSHPKDQLSKTTRLRRNWVAKRSLLCYIWDLWVSRKSKRVHPLIPRDGMNLGGDCMIYVRTWSKKRTNCTKPLIGGYRPVRRRSRTLKGIENLLIFLDSPELRNFTYTAEIAHKILLDSL